MELRICAPAEIRKDGSVSKAPDLSGFPIPRKGGARPLAGDNVGEIERGVGEGGSPEPSPPDAAVPPDADAASLAATTEVRKGAFSAPRVARAVQAPRAPTPPPPTYGQTVATTVKLDENRYLRLMEAGKPSPGRLRRRTIQDMLIEALDEWFERRQL